MGVDGWMDQSINAYRRFLVESIGYVADDLVGVVE
jgi:hypothetical protein